MPEIWVFQPTGAPNSFQNDLQLACGRRSWTYKPHKTTPRSVRDYRDRDVRIHTLNPQQATLLYVRLHRHPVGVLQLEETHVPITPKPVPRIRDYLPLFQFVKYKSFLHTINPTRLDAEQAEEILSAMENWVAEANNFAGSQILGVSRYMCSLLTALVMIWTRLMAGNSSIGIMDLRDQERTRTDSTGIEHRTCMG